MLYLNQQKTATFVSAGTNVVITRSIIGWRDIHGRHPMNVPPFSLRKPTYPQPKRVAPGKTRERDEMAWIPLSTDVGRHPKTGRAAEALGIPIPLMTGHLSLFWTWCMEFASDGDITRYTAKEIAKGAMFDGDPQTFVDALVHAGFVDRDGDSLLVHKWNEYGGKIHDQREATNNRVKKHRAKCNADVTLHETPCNAVDNNRLDETFCNGNGEDRERGDFRVYPHSQDMGIYEEPPFVGVKEL